MEYTRNNLKGRLKVLVPIAMVALVIMLAMTIAGVVFFLRGRAIMEEQLKDKLQSTAAAAAMQFDGETLDLIHKGDTIDSSPALRETVMKLHAMRDSITNVQFAYIMRKTEDPNLLEFVADGDLARTDAELDINKNGRVDDDEIASVPGEKYDWRGWPVLGTEAFLHPTVDKHVASDQWGSSISGYAPIRRSNGQVAGVLGIDMAADEFTSLSNSIFSPVALLLILLAAVCLGSGSSLFIWRRRLEALEKLEIERSGLLRLAFHQLGGPLTIISWSLEELEDEGPASIQRSIVNIQEGVKRLTSILKTLKSADTVHAGKIEYKAEFASLSSILEQVAKESAQKLALRGQRIVTELEQNITMKLDPQLISGVAQELLSNAIDFSPDKAVITLRSKRVGKYAEFSVVDHGCGIPRKDLSRMFEEFTRGGNATKYKADGNGLGLYIVKGIVEQASGRVFITSKEGKGTTVTVRLPIV